jgi:TonB family protein
MMKSIMTTILIVMSVTQLSGQAPRDHRKDPQIQEIVIPSYPQLANGAREEGQVNVRVTIDSAGTVSEAKAISGPQRLRVLAEASAIKCKFMPSKRGPIRWLIEFAFILQDGVGTAEPAAVYKYPNRIEIYGQARLSITPSGPSIR